MKSFTVIDFGHGKRVPENVYCRIRKENIRNSGKNRESKQHFFHAFGPRKRFCRIYDISRVYRYEASVSIRKTDQRNKKKRRRKTKDMLPVRWLQVVKFLLHISNYICYNNFIHIRSLAAGCDLALYNQTLYHL